jgi:murein DD-endopeptidase MepM/ murein hydrolase activator NlpD
VDWKAPIGTPVITAGMGRVTVAEYDPLYGNRVIINHGREWRTVYAHLSAIDVKPGDSVDTGTVIGAVGSTGLPAGPHLHFEVWRNGQALDPMLIDTGASVRKRK